MMRRLVQRHHGILPLDTAESIWRVIIATFTHVQAPFSVHADLSAGDALMRDSARFHFGFTVPFVPHMGAAGVVAAVSESKGDLGLVPAFATAGGGAWWTALEFESAPKIIARLPFVDRADHPAPLHVFVVSRAAADAMVTEVEMWSVRVAGWSAERRPRRRRAGRDRSRCRTAPSTARRCWSRCPPAASSTDVTAALVKAGASVRSTALVGSHATRYTVPAEASAAKPSRESSRIDAMTATRPQPRPGVLDIDAYVPGKSSAPGVAKVFKLSSNETPLGPSPKAIAAYNEVGQAPGGLPGRLRLRRCARRSAAPSGSIPARIVCGAGSDDLLNLLARAYLADGDEAIHTTHGFLVYPIATLGTGATPVVAPEKNYTADVDAILTRGDAEDQDRVPRQSEQSDRHLHAVRRGQAPAQRACRRTCCSCSTRPMPNTCAATTTRPASSWSRPARTS